MTQLQTHDRNPTGRNVPDSMDSVDTLQLQLA
jgi:hypothetical protein